MNKLTARLQEMLDDRRIKIGWYQQSTLREAVVALRVFEALLNRDIHYESATAVLPFESHTQAINHIAEARRACDPGMKCET